jgi:hypothetical protein
VDSIVATMIQTLLSARNRPTQILEAIIRNRDSSLSIAIYVPASKSEIADRIWLARSIPVGIKVMRGFVNSLIMRYGIGIGIDNSSRVRQHTIHLVVIISIISKETDRTLSTVS